MPRKRAAAEAAPGDRSGRTVYTRPLSHSSISMYLECPLKFKLKYLDKLPEAPKWFFSFGQSVHAALEFLYSVPALPPPTLEKVLEHYKAEWRSEGYRDAEQEREHLLEGERILRDFYRKHLPTFRLPLFAEYEFKLDVEGVPVTGFVDRIDKLDNGNLAVVDYKTGKAIARERLEKDRQLTMYQLAVEQLLGARVEALTFYHLPSQTPLTVGPRPAEQLDALRRTVADVNEAIEARRFDPKPDEKVCQWCDFRPHCPVFKGMYGAPPAAAAAARLPGAPAPSPAASAQDELAQLVDRYGDVMTGIERGQAEALTLRREIAARLAKSGYIRAFGTRFEVRGASEVRWEFGDRSKVLEVLKRHGLYDKVLKPSAPEVYRLLASADLPDAARRDLEQLGTRTDAPNLSLKPLP